MITYIVLIVSLVGIVFGADWLVAGSVSIARKFKVSDFVIGAAIVGVGTSMPELVVSFIGALEGNSDVAIGNVVGSNIFNILGILGITAIFFPIAISKENLKFEIPFNIFICILIILLAMNYFNGTPASLNRPDGIILLIIFGIFMWYSFHRDKIMKQLRNETEEFKNIPLGPSVIRVLAGLAILITSCDFFVDNAVKLAKSFGVNDAFISLTLIACGTSLPELAASIAAARKKNTQLALGNIIGSNIFNATLILGVSAQVMPLTSGGITIVDYLVMTAAALIPLMLGIGSKIGRVSGFMMFFCFVGYTWYLLSNQLQLL